MLCYEFYFFVDTINDNFHFFIHTFIPLDIHSIDNYPLFVMVFFQSVSVSKSVDRSVSQSVGHQSVCKFICWSVLRLRSSWLVGRSVGRLID